MSDNKKPVCITGKNPYGLCSCCHSDGRKCCIGCSEAQDCNIRCGWIDDLNTENENGVQKGR